MDSNTTEMKAIAKSIGASLKRSGCSVPHSLILNALAASINKRNWHVLQGTQITEVPPNIPTTLEEVTPPLKVYAKLLTSHGGMLCHVDVTEILAVADQGYLDDFLEGEQLIAGFMLFNVNDTFKEEWAKVQNAALSVSAERFIVDPIAALQWLDLNRREEIARMLCDKAGIEVSLAGTLSNPCWLWSAEDMEGPASLNYSTASSREEVLIEAYESQNLLSIELAKHTTGIDGAGRLYDVPITVDTTLSGRVQVKAESVEEAIELACEMAARGEGVKLELDDGNYRGACDYYCPDSADVLILA